MKEQKTKYTLTHLIVGGGGGGGKCGGLNKMLQGENYQDF